VKNVKSKQQQRSSIDVVVYVVTDAWWHVKTMTAGELASIVTTREHKQLLALAIGETLTLKRDFGSKQMQITATSI